MEEIVAPRRPPAPRPQPVTVLYIMGAPRCGSTVLDNVLNEVDGFFSAGELRFLWQRVHQGRFCGCGKSFESCEIWSRVVSELAASGHLASAEEARERQKAISGTRRTWQLLHQIAKGNVPHETEAHAQLTGRLYGAVQATTGARVIVDSSKRPWDAALLSHLDGVSPYFVHLIRDPRAMAYSQSRAKANPDQDQPAFMAPTGVGESSLQWIRRNLSADAVRRAQPAERSLVIAYHELCARPREVVQAIVALVGESDAVLPFTDEHTVRLGGNHTVSGNPDRFRTGLVPIREDDRWRRAMSRRDRAIVTALTGPLMLRYARVTHRGSAKRIQPATSAHEEGVA